MSEEVKKANAKQEEQEVPTQSNTLQEKAPKESSLTGELVDKDYIDKFDIVVLTIQDASGKSTQASISEKYSKMLNLDKRFPVGCVVTAAVEERVKDSTTYEKNGELKTHDSSGFSIQRLAKSSRSSFLEEKAMGKIESCEEGRANAVSSYFANTHSAMIRQEQ